MKAGGDFKRQESNFFFEKKAPRPGNQKTFAPLARAGFTTRGPV
jgi:hypothetical protein